MIQKDLITWRATFWRYLMDAHDTDLSKARETTLAVGHRWVSYVQPNKPNPPRKRQGWAAFESC